MNAHPGRPQDKSKTKLWTVSQVLEAYLLEYCPYGEIQLSLHWLVGRRVLTSALWHYANRKNYDEKIHIVTCDFWRLKEWKQQHLVCFSKLLLAVDAGIIKIGFWVGHCSPGEMKWILIIKIVLSGTCSHQNHHCHESSKHFVISFCTPTWSWDETTQHTLKSQTRWNCEILNPVRAGQLWQYGNTKMQSNASFTLKLSC